MRTLVPIPLCPCRSPEPWGTAVLRVTPLSLSPSQPENTVLSSQCCQKSHLGLLQGDRSPACPSRGWSRVLWGQGVGDVPSRALTPSASPWPGRLAVRYRMYRQVQLPRYRRAGPALQQRRCPHHCRCHQGTAITAPRPHPRISMGCQEHLCVVRHRICHASGIPSSRWKSHRASGAGIGPCARLINSQPC